MRYIQANTNGRLHDASEPSMSPLNRGFLYGDSIYEVWRTYGGVLFAWDEHWVRLEASASALGFDLVWSRQDVFEQIKRTVGAFRKETSVSTEIYVRLQIFRGSGPIGLDAELATDPGYVILVQPVSVLSRGALEQGLSLHIARGLKRNPIDSLSPAWKSGNYLNNLMCLREAKQAGADDALMLNHAGFITEATTSNIAFIRDGYFITPPVSVGILVGVTRKVILEHLAKSIGLKVETGTISPDSLPTMDECMLLSSTKDVQPVGRVNENRFPVSSESVTFRLKQEFARYAADYAQAHPELAV